MINMRRKCWQYWTESDITIQNWSSGVIEKSHQLSKIITYYEQHPDEKRGSDSIVVKKSKRENTF